MTAEGLLRGNDTLTAARRAERARLVENLLWLAECGESWQGAARRCGYEHAPSLTTRLYRSGDLERVRSAFAGARIWVAA
jgi:hypothetical protein